MKMGETMSFIDVSHFLSIQINIEMEMMEMVI
jgi:hypothetical protein